MEDKKELTEEMRRDVETFSEKQKAVRDAKNLEQRKLVIHGRRTGEGKYVRVDGRDEAIMGLEGSTVVRYSLAKKEVLFVVAKGTKTEKTASLQKIDQILEEYNLDEDAKTYYEKIKAALEKSLARNTRKENIEKGGAEGPTKEEPNTEPEKPANPGPEKPNLFAKRAELEQQVRSLNKYIQECQSESNIILARASIHGLMPDDEQTLKDNNNQLKAMKEQLRKVEEELAKLKEETDKDLDKYLDNKKVLDDIEKGVFPKDVEQTTIMEVLESNIANREAMLMGDRAFGPEYIAELNAWKKMLAAYKRGDISGIDTKSADGKRDYMDSIREEAARIIKTKYADTLRKENSDIEEKIKSEGLNPELLLTRREKEREEAKREREEQARREKEEKERKEKEEQARREKEEKERKEKEDKERREKEEQAKREKEEKERKEREEQLKREQQEKGQRKSETELLRQSPAYISNGGKLGYESLTIFDKFRAKRKAYEMANGKKPGLLRSALLILPSLKYSRLADEFIESGELSIDDIVYAKYKREIQYFDKEYERLEEPEKKEPEKEKPTESRPEGRKPVTRKVEESKPEKKEPEKPVGSPDRKPKKPLAERASNAFYRVDRETQARLRRVGKEAAERKAEKKDDKETGKEER